MSLSKELFQKSQNIIPGGVNSPVRSFSSVGGNPIYMKKGEGPYMIDMDDQKYIDFCGSWGPLILGHAYPDVVSTIAETAKNGISFGTNHPLEPELATLISQAIPSIEKVRMTTSGTEATMTALRLARGFTGKTKLVKFEGCYHGHSDAFLVNAGSGLLTNAISSSAGIPPAAVADTIAIPYNDFNSLEAVFKKYPNEIACVIVEPVAGNMGIIPPAPGFLEKIRELTTANHSLFIFDEVITGFRLCYGGYQNLTNITPDLTTLGKIIGGGLPIGAVGGKKEIMDHLSPLGAVYQAGTLSGNPVALACGLKTLQTLKEKNVHQVIAKRTTEFIEKIKPAVINAGCTIYSNASAFCIYFQENMPSNLTEMKNCDISRFNEFYHQLLKKGIYFSPSQFEANFVSYSHTDEVLSQAAEIIKECLQ